jgi:amino acid adenylation domain-containing protein
VTSPGAEWPSIVDLVQARASELPPEAGPPQVDPRALLAMAPAERHAALSALLRLEAARVLRVPPASVSPSAPLTRLGLDSLAAIDLKQSLESCLGISLPFTDLLGGAGLDLLTQNLLEQVAAAPEEAVPLQRAAAGAEAPLSAGQKALWFLGRLGGESGPYHIVAAARVRPERPGGPRLDTSTLRRALDALVERHAALRTTFHEQGGKLLQRVHAALAPGLVEVDAAGWSAAELQGRMEEEADRPFDLAAGPLLRLAVFRRVPEEDVILLVVHHIVADFWTLANLARDLSALYTGQALPPLPIAFADHVLWQEGRLAGREGERLWAYWGGRLTPPPPVLDLPSDRPRAPVRSYKGGAERLRFSPELGDLLASLARARGATLYATLLAGLQGLLHRYTGQEDLVVGAPAAGRSRPELAGLCGYFVNLLVLRADLSGDPTFGALVGQTARVVLGALEHQDYPFLLVAERLQPERDLSRSPLVQTVFVLDKPERPEESGLAAFALGVAGGRLGFGGLTFESWEVPERFSQFDLVLRMGEVEGALVASLQYSSDLFEAVTTRRMLGHLQELLLDVASDPERPLSTLRLLTASERSELLAEWSGVASSRAVGDTIHGRFAEQATAQPWRVAVVAGEMRLTYGELETQANRLAHLLQVLGVEPEVPVALCLERSLELVVATLAVLKAGGAYVPLDPSLPAERLALLLADSRAPVVLTTSASTKSLPHGIQVVCLDTAAAALAACSAAAPRCDAGPENLAYVMYTSGSTGRPKGVLIPHRGVLRLVRETSYAELGPGEVFLQLAPPSFDAATLEIWGPLLNGGRLVVSHPGVPSLAELERVVAAEGVTALWLTAGLFHQVVDHRIAALSGVRQLLAGGDVLSPAHVHRALSELPGSRLINGYGPTENTTFTCCYEVPRVPRPAGPVPIGRPIAGTRVYVLDRGLAPQPVGVPGELCAGGAGLARGYLGCPEQTARAFVPDPVGGEPGARLYRTGDLVRWRPDRNLEFLGRIDHQCKVRGFRIEPEEVEIALGEHSTVARAAVAFDPAGKQLVAYVVARPGTAPGAEELGAFLANKLPGFMVPSAFVFLPELPLTSHGKLDRRALPAPDGSRSEAPFKAPRSDLEKTLAAIWAAALGVERVGVSDNFFSRGGHSLKAIQVLAHVRDAFGVELPVRSLFEGPTVAQQALAVVKEAAASAGREALSTALVQVK